MTDRRFLRDLFNSRKAPAQSANVLKKKNVLYTVYIFSSNECLHFFIDRVSIDLGGGCGSNLFIYAADQARSVRFG